MWRTYVNRPAQKPKHIGHLNRYHRCMNENNLDWVTIKVNPIDDNTTSRKANIRSYIWWQVLIYVLYVECVFSCLYIYHPFGLYWIYDEARFCFRNPYTITKPCMLSLLFVFLISCRPHPCLYIIYIFVDTKKFVKSYFLEFLDFDKNWLNGTCPPHFYLLYWVCSCFG